MRFSIAETSVGTSFRASLGKIANLFAGDDLYGLLGFVWFERRHEKVDWRLSSQAAIAASPPRRRNVLDRPNP